MVLLMAVFFLSPGSAYSSDKPGTLKKIYQTGKIRFHQAQRIDLDSFPENVPIKLVGAVYQHNSRAYIVDPYLCSIHILKLDGTYEKSFGQKGQGPSDLLYPHHICFSDGKIVIWEIGNRRFSIFTPEGVFIKHIPYKKKERLTKMKPLANGQFIIETESSPISRANPYQMVSIKLYSEDLKFIKTIYREKVLRNKYVNKPIRQNIPQPFNPDVLWDVATDNHVVIAFSKEYRFEILDVESGQIKKISRQYTPLKVEEKDKQLFFDGIVRTSTNSP